MTCLEHLIENTLRDFSEKKSTQEICGNIEKDVNLFRSGITGWKCYEICQFIFYNVLPYANDYLKDDNTKI